MNKVNHLMAPPSRAGLSGTLERKKQKNKTQIHLHARSLDFALLSCKLMFNPIKASNNNPETVPKTLLKETSNLMEAQGGSLARSGISFSGTWMNRPFGFLTGAKNDCQVRTGQVRVPCPCNKDTQSTPPNMHQVWVRSIL